MSSVWHAYTPTRSLRSSSAHLPVSELHLLLVASDLLDHKFGRLYQITSNLLPLSSRSDPDSKLTSLLQLVNNWPPIKLSALLIRRHTRFCARYKCFTLHYLEPVEIFKNLRNVMTFRRFGDAPPPPFDGCTFNKSQFQQDTKYSMARTKTSKII